MTRTFLIRALAVSLMVCLLFVGALASAQSISHESQHAHHQKSSHATVLCSWMCAAGQVLDGIHVVPDVGVAVVLTGAPATIQNPGSLPLNAQVSRGPPTHQHISVRAFE